MPSLVEAVSIIVTKKLKTDTVHYEILSQLSQGRGGKFILKALIIFKMTHCYSKYHYTAPKSLTCNY